jgi:ankyrin repeat protein
MSLSDLKELTLLNDVASQLIHNDDGTTFEYCPDPDLVAVLEDILQQCNTDEFQSALAAASLAESDAESHSDHSLSHSHDCHSELCDCHSTLIVRPTHILRKLLHCVLTANISNNRSIIHSCSYWSDDGFRMVARIVKAILSSWCIDKKSCIDHVDAKGWTALMLAAANGHVLVVQQLLADPRVDTYSINQTDQDDTTALMLAAKNGRAAIVGLLLADARIDKDFIDFVDRAESNALMHATRYGQASVVKLMLADDRVDKDTIEDACGLIAAQWGHTSVMEQLLASVHFDEASFAYTNASGWHALMLAAQRGHVSVVELLLADVRMDKDYIDHASRRGWTAIMLAARNGHASIVALLLADARVDKTSIDFYAQPHEWTAFTLAAQFGYSAVIELLLADARIDKASIDHRDRSGSSALMYAAWNGHISVVELLLADARVDNASVDAANEQGKNAIALAIINGQSPVITTLLSSGRTSWHSLVKLTTDSKSQSTSFIYFDNVKRHTIPCVTAELTRRQMSVIYPSVNRNLRPVRTESDGRDDTHCALLHSFFDSPLLDVNVLGIIHEYVKYTA